MTRTLQENSAVLPVTALTFCHLERLYVLAGEGRYLKIFDHDDNCLLRTERVFDTETVHGIACQTYEDTDGKQALLLVWGGRSVCVLGVKICFAGNGALTVELNKLVPELRLKDWTLDGCFHDHESVFSDSEGPVFEAVLIVAHNELYRLSFSTGNTDHSQKRHFLSHIASGPRSMLYSAHVIWPVDCRILVTTGTVFGEVFYWSCSFERKDSLAITTLHSVFTGHEGSVFGVEISELGEENDRILASCSDDRTIRVWDINETALWKLARKSGEEQNHNSEPGSNNIPNAVATTACLAMTTGHASRIWGLRFLRRNQHGTELLSQGEDGTTQIWRMNASIRSTSAVPAKMDRSFDVRHQKTFSYHSGKNIWATAIFKKSSSELVIGSGGADGKIVTYRPTLQENVYSSDVQSLQFTMTQVATSVKWATSSRSRTPTRMPTERIFDSLAGHWRLSRKIGSRKVTYPSGTLEGSATFARRPPSDDSFSAEYLYSENGEFITEQGMRMKATRQYVYRYKEIDDIITVWFVKPDDGSTVDYYFHSINLKEANQNGLKSKNSTVELELTASDDHLCVQDNYDATYSFRIEDETEMQWSVTYLVTGPGKDYTSKTSYTRDESIDTSSPIDSPEDSTSLMDEGAMQALKSDTFKAYSWINGTDFLTITQAGNLLIGTRNTENKSRDEGMIFWELIDQQPSLKSSCICSSVSCLGLVFLTGIDGSIFLYQHDLKTMKPIYKLARKVAFLKAQFLSPRWSRDSRNSNMNVIGILATYLGTKEANVILFTAREGSSDVSLQDEFHLDLPTNFVVTSSCFMDNEDLIVLGSRSGGIAFYDLSNTVLSSTSSDKPQMFEHVHGKEAVTTILNISLNARDDSSTHILTAGRDGTYAIHHVAYNRNPDNSSLHVDFQTLHIGTPPFGPNIEAACIDANDLYLWGFRSTESVVYNESQKIEVMAVDCGGAHRSWAYNHNADGSAGGSFVYSKASMCHLYTQTKPSHQVLQHGGHGREIKAMALSPAINNGKDGQSRFLATGAEDTAVRIFNTKDQDRRNACLNVLTNHTTGLQELKWSPDGHYLFSAAGCEEFFVWRIRPAPLVTVGVVCEAKCLVVSDERDLRIMDFAVLTIDYAADDENRNQGNSDPDYLLSMAYSDSSIRIFRYQTTTQTFTLLFEGTYTTHCLTQITYLSINDILHLCTGSTDGHMALWPLAISLPPSSPSRSSSTIKNISPISIISSPNALPPGSALTITPSHRIATHQNSIKSLLSTPFSLSLPSNRNRNLNLITTAGDDGAIAFTLLASHSSDDHHSTLLIPKAHASAVSAISFLGPDCSREEHESKERSVRERVIELRFMSVGDDQRIKIWRVCVDLVENANVSTATGDDLDGVEVNVQREANVSTGVADASTLVVSGNNGDDETEEEKEERRIWIAGVGLEEWRISDSDADDGDRPLRLLKRGE